MIYENDMWEKRANCIWRFSFDVRGRAFNKALNWSDSTAVGPRAYFVTVTKPAALSLEAVQLDDEGVYRCRVDFKNSPTKNFQVNLTVIGERKLINRNDRRNIAPVWLTALLNA